MSIYRNNNGTLESIATNTHISNQPMEDYITQENFNSLGYITPEMFGAKGDGVTNDAEAFRAAFAHSNSIRLSDKKYLLGNEIIDVHTKIHIEVIGQNRSRIIGGTFIININDTWTDAYDRQGYRFPSHFENIFFDGTNYYNNPTIITSNPILIENCYILNYDKFLVLPNTSYIDRVNFLECNMAVYKTKIDVSDTIGNLIYGCDGVDQYSDWTGAGDNWAFTNCSYAAIGYYLPSFHVSSHNHSVVFTNCINPSVTYGDVNDSKTNPQIYFNGCHIENQYNVCALKDGYNTYVPPMVSYTNCFFHSYSQFNKYDWFMGMNLYISMAIDYASDSIGGYNMGLTPDELNRYTGVIVPHGSKFKYIKTPLTEYSIPETRNISTESNAADRTRVTPVTDNMDYVFYYSDNPYTYDASTKITKENVTPNQNNYFCWRITIDDGNRYNNYFMHIFRKNLNTNQVQKCVIYISEFLLNINYLLIHDGGNSIDGVYKWIDYDGELPL